MLAGMCNISDRVFSTLEFSGPETLIPKVKKSFKKSFKSMIYECGLNAKVSGQKLSI